MSSCISLKQVGLLLLLSFSVILTGCGGSHSSSSSSSFAPSDSATVNVVSVPSSAGPNYLVVVSRSGAATYTNYTGQPTTGQTGSGTISASLTSQFFANLDAVASGPPQVMSLVVGGSSDTVSYSGKVIGLAPSSNAQYQALYDESNAIAKTLGLPPKPAGL